MLLNYGAGEDSSESLAKSQFTGKDPDAGKNRARGEGGNKG